MPYKKVSIERMEEPLHEAKEIMQYNRSSMIVYYIIIGTIILFGINVAYETYDNMLNINEITESKSKTCLVDFQKNTCNPLKLT